jgi:uncharacterized protein YndB with AHSA1/START domain
MEVDANPKAAAGSDLEFRIEVNDRSEIVGETRTRATMATVFALLTEARGVMTWLAHYAETDARAGGVFCLADPGGLRVEGTYLEVIAYQKVVLTWGGIEGLRPGQSTVAFALHADGSDTMVRLRHSANRMTAAVKAVGISEPPHKPWRARNTIIERISHAVLQSTLARVKPAAEAATNQRVDMTWLSHADSGMTTISAIK